MTSFYLMKGSQIKVLKGGIWISYTTKKEIAVVDMKNRHIRVISPMVIFTEAEYEGFKIQYRECHLRKSCTKLAGDGSCRKCGGSGYIPGFQHIQGGKCFSCGPVGN